MDDPENLSSTQDLHASGEDSQESFSLLHPTKIGRYTILGRLGKGGFGEVFLAHDDELDRPVAIKVPTPRANLSARGYRGYLTEARILARLDHPHIVPVYDVGRTDDGLCFVVSKFIEGSDLATRIKEARPGFHESAELVATVAEALHYAHTRGLVHRDIKPANILIDASGSRSLPTSGWHSRTKISARVAGSPERLLHESRAGPGRGSPGRWAIRHLQPGRRLLRTADRTTTVPERDRRARRAAGPDRHDGSLARPARSTTRSPRNWSGSA